MGTRARAYLSRYAKLAIPLSLLLMSFNGCASASPWTLPRGDALIISRADYFNADLGPVNTLSGLVDSRFQRLESNTYVEFGVTDRFMIGGKAIVGTSWLTRGAAVETVTGVSEAEIFAQYQLFRNADHAGSLRISAARPSNFESGVRPELQHDGSDLEVSALYGRNLLLAPIKVFATTDAGFRKRFGDAADQARFQATLGVEPSTQFLFLIDAYATLSLKNENPGGADYDIVKIQPSLLWRASPRWGVQAGITEEVAGRNIAFGRTFFLGLWSRF